MEVHRTTDRCSMGATEGAYHAGLWPYLVITLSANSPCQPGPAIAKSIISVFMLGRWAAGGISAGRLSLRVWIVLPAAAVTPTIAQLKAKVGCSLSSGASHRVSSVRAVFTPYSSEGSTEHIWAL